MVGESVSSVIAHAAAAVCIVVPMLETTLASQSHRNTLTLSGAHGLVWARGVGEVTASVCRAEHLA